MTKRDITKLAKLVSKNTQKEALYTFLSQGYEFTVAGAKNAGIGDPRRVVNQLRTEHGIPVYQNDRKLRNGEVVRHYSLVGYSPC